MASTLPKSFRQIVAHTLSADFRAATKIVTQDMPTSIEPSQVLVRNVWAGINASDINFTAGRCVVPVDNPFVEFPLPLCFVCQ